ncbi:Detected protein of unknown function [Hibiscus syriacus]|uniref:Uncharacterized protein n=1 Tax=Hibiscus syriacus TaxID=106335 RepID=A0A6A3B1Y1_HIBSY|nr:Detected protein of unknown function [Hibiscus syriacus]
MTENRKKKPSSNSNNAAVSNSKSRPKEAKVKKEEPVDDDDEDDNLKCPSRVLHLGKGAEEKEEKGGRKESGCWEGKKRKKKVYDLPGQKRDPPGRGIRCGYFMRQCISKSLIVKWHNSGAELNASKDISAATYKRLFQAKASAFEDVLGASLHRFRGIEKHEKFAGSEVERHGWSTCYVGEVEKAPSLLAGEVEQRKPLKRQKKVLQQKPVSPVKAASATKSVTAKKTPTVSPGSLNKKKTGSKVAPKQTKKRKAEESEGSDGDFENTLASRMKKQRAD